MKQSDGWLKRYAASFAIRKSCLRRSNAFYKSVSSIPATFDQTYTFLKF